MQKNTKKKLSAKEVEEALESEGKQLLEIPPYTRINMAMSSEGVQVELEENERFSLVQKHYQKLLKEVSRTHMMKKQGDHKDHKSKIGGVEIS